MVSTYVFDWWILANIVLTQMTMFLIISIYVVYCDWVLCHFYYQVKMN